LFPIHWPLPTPYDGDFVSTWQTLEGFKNEATGRTPAQVVLRWHIQRGDIVFPKSVTPQRVRENFALFDFELTDSDIDALTGLDNGEAGRSGPNPDRFDYIPR
jgi:2,5-diketo-D-gluconate reductase A